MTIAEVKVMLEMLYRALREQREEGRYIFAEKIQQIINDYEERLI